MVKKKPGIRFAVTVLVVAMIMVPGLYMGGEVVSGSESYDKELLSRGNVDTNSRSGQYNIGKVWVEDFSDLDSLESWNNIKQSEKGITLDDDEILLFADNFTKSDIDTNRWFIEEGEGTVLTSSDELIAFKEGWTQDADTYMESYRDWQVERRLVFEWNSVEESGLSGYEHEIDAYFVPKTNDRIWITVRGDRQVKLHSSNNAEPVGPPYILSENRWYRFNCQVTTDTVIFKIEEKDGKAVNYQNLSHGFKDRGKVRFIFARNSMLKADFEIRIDNVALYAGYKQKGDLITNMIYQPIGFEWDRFNLEKFENAPYTRITIDVLDGISDTTLPGHTGIVSSSHDLSDLNNGLYTSLRFRVSFTGNILSTPELYKLSVAWQDQNSMQDTFIDKAKLASYSNVVATDQNLKLISGNDEGYAISEVLEIPPEHFWNTILLNKYEPAQNSYLTLTLIDHSTHLPIEGYVNLFEDKISLKDLDPVQYPKIYMRVNFFGYSSSDPVLFAWSINWSANRPPVIIELFGTSSMYRGETEIFNIYIVDPDEPVESLTVSVQYRTGFSAWESTFLGKPSYESGLWTVTFSPTEDASIGSYSFKISISDFFGKNDSLELTDFLVVLNVPLEKPDVILSPSQPSTKFDLKCFVTLPHGTSEDDITIRYRWYQNGILQPGLIFDTVPADYTTKYDIWKVAVTLFDGHDESQAGTAEVFIKNSPPAPIPGDINVQVSEDSINETGLLLNSLFHDGDNDLLNFTVLPIDHIGFKLDEITKRLYFTPEPNWYGKGTINIYASDDSQDTSKSVTLEVLPLNDAPVLSAIGNQILSRLEGDTPRFNALEEETVKLQVYADDIDGDKLTYSTDRTDGKDDNDLEYIKIDKDTGLIEIKPPRGTVGDIRINISVSDNNGSKIWRDIVVNIQEKSESEFSQFLIPTNWLVIIVGLIVIFVSYYAFVFIRIKYDAFKRRKYREKLSGLGKIYAYYPIAITGSDPQLSGRYPRDGADFQTFSDPYRAARYALPPSNYVEVAPDGEDTEQKND